MNGFMAPGPFKSYKILASSISGLNTFNLITLFPNNYSKITTNDIILNPLANSSVAYATDTNRGFQAIFNISKSISTSYILTTSMYINLYWVDERVSHIADISYSVYALVN